MESARIPACSPEHIWRSGPGSSPAAAKRVFVASSDGPPVPLCRSCSALPIRSSNRCTAATSSSVPPCEAATMATSTGSIRRASAAPDWTTSAATNGLIADRRKTGRSASPATWMSLPWQSTTTIEPRWRTSTASPRTISTSVSLRMSVCPRSARRASGRAPVRQVVLVSLGQQVERHVLDRQRLVAVALGHVRRPRVLPVDDPDRTRSQNFDAVRADDHRRVLVDPDPKDARVLGDRAEEAAHPAAFREVHVDHDPVEEAESRGHSRDVADPRRVVAVPVDQHGLAHHGGSGRRPGDEAASLEELRDSLVDRRVADVAGDAELVAAGEEDAAGAGDRLAELRVERDIPIADIDVFEMVDAELREHLPIALPGLLRLLGRAGHDHERPAVDAVRHVAEDVGVLFLVLATADDDEGSWLWLRCHPSSFCAARRGAGVPGFPRWCPPG